MSEGDAMWRARRGGLRFAVLVALVVGVLPVPALAAEQVITSAGPLTRVAIGDDLRCAVNHTGDDSGEFYSDDACGTFVLVGTQRFSPADIPLGTAAVGTPWTVVGQTPVSGSGTGSSPYTITTTVAAGTTGVRIVETDSYVVGQESYRTDVRIENTGGATQTGILWRAADCYLQDSDRGFGAAGSPAGAVACVAADSADPTQPGDRIEQWLPLTAGSKYFEGRYDAVWTRIGQNLPFDDTCECSTQLDNGAGLSWEWSLAGGASKTYSHLTTFSPLGTVPLTTAKVAEQSQSAPGAANRYTITVANSNTQAVTVTAVTDTLPTGFSYTAGSTTGVTTANPSIADGGLTWQGPFTVTGGASLTLSFAVTVATQGGSYDNEAGATAENVAVVPTGPTARITVTSSTPSPSPTPTPTATPSPSQSPTTEPPVDRFEDPTGDVKRIAELVCQFLFEVDGAAEVVLARDDVFADTLAGAPLAAAHGCILFTPGGPDQFLDPLTRTEIDRALPAGARISILGGQQAVSSAVEAELRGAGYAVGRFSGADRILTAVAIAREVNRRSPGAARAVLAFASDWPDAVTAGAWASTVRVPVLLTYRDALHPDTASALQELGVTNTVVMGGTAVISDQAMAAAPGSMRVSGPNRMGSAVSVASSLWGFPPGAQGPNAFAVVNLEVGNGWALALAASPVSVRYGAPQIGVRAASLPSETGDYLRGITRQTAPDIFVMGGREVVADPVATQVYDLVQP